MNKECTLWDGEAAGYHYLAMREKKLVERRESLKNLSQKWRKQADTTPVEKAVVLLRCADELDAALGVNDE